MKYMILKCICNYCICVQRKLSLAFDHFKYCDNINIHNKSAFCKDCKSNSLKAKRNNLTLIIDYFVE